MPVSQGVNVDENCAVAGAAYNPCVNSKPQQKSQGQKRKFSDAFTCKEEGYSKDDEGGTKGQFICLDYC